MRITVITWLTTVLLLAIITRTNGSGERSSKQLFYTTYLYPSSSSSSSSLSSPSLRSSAGVISNANSNAFLTPQFSISPFQSFWSSFGDQKGRQTATLIPVSNANQHHSYQQQQQLQKQQFLWSPSLPLGTSFISSPFHQQQLLQQHHHQHSGLTTATGGSAAINNIHGSANNAASKTVKHASLSPSSHAQFILQSQQQIGPEYQIHTNPTSSAATTTTDSNGNSLSGLPIIGYVNVPLNPTYNVWNPYRSVTGTPQTTVQSYLQNGMLSQNQWNLPLKSYEQIHNELLSNSIVPPFKQQPGNPLFKGFQRGHVEASPPSVLSSVAPTHGLKTVSPADPAASGGFIRGHIESKPGLVSFQQVVAGIRNSGENSIRQHQQQQQQLHQNHLSFSSSSGFNRGAVEHRFPESSVQPLEATTYDTPTKNVVCYFASWAFDRKREGKFVPENADPTLCTHIIYAFAVLDKSKFAIKESDPITDNKKCLYQRTVQLKKRNPSVKILLAMGGTSDSGDDKYSLLAHNQVVRRKFARETAQFLKERNFDGMSLDWHYPRCWQSQCNVGPESDKQAFTDLIRDLKTVFEKENLILTATLSGYQDVIDVAYDIPALSRSLDFMSIMTFDYHGSWDPKTGHLAPLYNGPPAQDPYPHYNANYTMEYYAAKGADRSKLMLGVPMYGQSFQLSNPGDTGYGSEASGPGMPGDYTRQPGMLAFYEICKKVKTDGWTVQRDITGSWGPYAYKGNQWVGFEDSDSIIRKSRFVKAQGYGGMLVWTIDLDDFNNQCCMGSQPLLRRIARELLNVQYDSRRTDCSKPEVVAPPESSPCQGISEPSPPQQSQPTTGVPPIPTGSPTSTTQHHHYRPTTTSSSSIDTWSSPSTPSVTELETTSSSASLILYCQHLLGTNQPMYPVSTTVSTTPSSINNPTQACDGTWLYRPDPNDCGSYDQCSTGRIFKHRCSHGLHWNKFANICDWPQSAGCQDLMQSTTNQQMYTTARPTTTSTMWTTQTTTTTRPPTTTTQWTPPSTQATTTTTTTMSTTRQPPAPPAWPPSQAPPPQNGESCMSGQYLPGPTCDKFYVCAAGRKTLQSCGSGLFWNQEKYLCDWPRNVMCQMRIISASIIMPSVQPIPVREGPCNEGEYSGDPSDCQVYYICDHGKKIKFRCQSGLYWNNNAKVCDWPANVDCSASSGGGGGGGSQTTTTTTPRPEYSSTQATTTTTTTTQSSWTPTTTTTTTSTYMPPSGGGGSGGDDAGTYKVVCYFTNWAFYRPDAGKYVPDDIDGSLCTHIVYGFAVLDYSTLLMKPHDTWADYDNKFYEKVTGYKAKGVKVTLAIGGWNDSEGDKYSRLVNNPQARRAFITNAIDFIKKNNFDGLDLDWEYPKCWMVDCNKGPASDKPAFAAFVRELKEAFQPEGLLLSAAVSPSKNVIDEAYDVPTMSKYLDWIAVMTYDYHGQWDKKTGHVAPLYFHDEADYFYYNTNYTMHYWAQLGADRKKLVMGMPMYGQSFTLTNPSNNGLNAPTSGGGQAGEYTRASGFLAYYEICQRVQRDQWTVVQDPSGAIGPYAYKGNQWVSYDDVPMIRKKSELIKKMGLGGGMIWALDLDDFRNTCGQGKYPLLTTINSVLGRKRVSSGVGTHSTGLRPSKRPTGLLSTNVPVLEAYPSVVSVIVHQQELQPIKENQPDPCSQAPYKPYDGNCRKYYRCIFGKYVEQTCPTGTFWNKDRCDWTCGSGDTGDSQHQAHQPIPPEPTTQRPTTQLSTAKPYTPTTTTATTSTTQWTWNPSSTSATPSTSTDWQWRPTISTTTTIHPIEVPESDYKVVCYFTNWSWYRQGIGKYKPEDIDYNLCTHIAYGFAVLDATNLVIKPHDSWADIDNQFYTQVTNLRSKGKKVVVAIGGWNDSAGDKYSKLVSDPAARQRFIKHVIEFIEKWNFDGLDLDWEYPKCWMTECKKGPESDKANFGAFVKELSDAFKPKGLLLSSAVSPSKMIIDEGYDVPTVSKYLDWIAVMTYDYHGQWDKKTGHVAPMYHHEESDNFYFNTNYTIHYWISQGADRKKLVMGMPMYGQSFTLADVNDHGLNAKSYGGGTAGDFTRAQGFLAYYEICSYVKNKDWKVVQDEHGAIGPYAYKGDQWVSYDDINMIRRKSQYIKDMNLGGGMIWALDLDDFRNVCGCEAHPLLKTINRVLRNYPTPDPQCSI